MYSKPGAPIRRQRLRRKTKTGVQGQGSGRHRPLCPCFPLLVEWDMLVSRFSLAQFWFHSRAWPSASSSDRLSPGPRLSNTEQVPLPHCASLLPTHNLGLTVQGQTWAWIWWFKEIRHGGSRRFSHAISKNQDRGLACPCTPLGPAHILQFCTHTCTRHICVHMHTQTCWHTTIHRDSPQTCTYTHRDMQTLSDTQIHTHHRHSWPTYTTVHTDTHSYSSPQGYPCQAS